MVNTVCSRAPVRICDIGGWTDTWFYPNGAVFNICIALYSYVKIIPTSNNMIKIFSENLNTRTEIEDIQNISYDGNLDLLKAAIKRMNIKEGMNIFVRTDIPPGSGTGTSASVAVALIAALARFQNIKLKPFEIAKLAHKLEIEELKLESGVQDQYSTAYGGINYMEIIYPRVRMIPLKIENKFMLDLEKRLILVFFSSRSSSVMHRAVIENYKKGDASTLSSFNIIKKCAYEMKKVVQSNNFGYMGELMNRNWSAQKQLHKLMVTSAIDKAEKIAMKNGALGFKVNGAGGGGSAIILAKNGMKHTLEQKLVENGFKILPVKLDFKGVQTWIS